MQINGELTGWVPSFYDKPEYNGEPTDFRLKVQVADAQDLVDEISKEYDRACEWWANETGKRRFFDAPFEMNNDGSAVIKLTAKLAYEEFPFPVVDSELNPLARDLYLKPGSKVIVHAEPVFHPRKAMKGGMRLKPCGIQVIEAVTASGRDSGGKDVSEMFTKVDGFKQSQPKVQELATVGSEDPDF